MLALVLALFLLAMITPEALGKLRGDRFSFLSLPAMLLLFLVAAHLAAMAVLMWRIRHAPAIRSLQVLAALAAGCVLVVLVVTMFQGGPSLAPTAMLAVLLALPIGAYMLLFRVGWRQMLTVPASIPAPASSGPASAAPGDLRPAEARPGRKIIPDAMLPYARTAMLLLLGGLAFQGVLSLFGGPDEAPVAAVTAPAPAAPQPPVDNGQRYSLLVLNQRKELYLYSGRTPSEAREDICPGCRVVAEGEGRCSAYLNFFLPWNSPIYAVARSTAEAEERVIRICQMRDASMRDCRGVRSFCAAE